MKKILLIVLAMALVFTACSDDSDSATLDTVLPPDDPDVTLPDDVEPTNFEEEIFFLALEGEGILGLVDNDALIDVALEGCAILDISENSQNAASQLLAFSLDVSINYDITAEQSGAIIGAGTVTYCPENTELLLNAAELMPDIS